MSTQAVDSTSRHTLVGFVADNTADETVTVYSDEHAGYREMVNHVAIRHKAGQYVHGDTRTGLSPYGRC